MKNNLLIPLFAFTFVLHLAASAAVPLKWTVETSRAQPAQFEAYQGETLDLEATLQSYGKPVELTGIAALYWQTNGMGSTYWEASAAVNSNRMSAVWTPEMDVGAKVYNCFIGQPGTIYHAAFQLRLRPSPGATPNVLPLPTPVIDFAKVRVLNPPWEGGGGGGVNTNAVIDIIHKTVDGAARPLPPYLHAIDFDDSYPEEAEEYYRERGSGLPTASCSAVRSGGFLSRNFDYPFDDRAEFVVRMSAGPDRFASVGVANVGTNLTESFVTSGKPSRCYKWLPGATVDGINEHGVACEINVVDTPVTGWSTTGDLHPLAAVRWALDHATNAQHAATYLAANIRFPEGWQQNFHYMIADEQETWVVENGSAHMVGTFANVAAMTNFRLYPTHSTGEGQERYEALMSGANITSQWWTLTYTPDGYRASDLPGITGEALTQLFDYWASKSREAHRGETLTTSHQPLTTNTWWQTVHTSIYDITNRVLRIAVQERDDWYTFALAKNGTDEAKVRELAAEVVAPVASTVSSLQSSVSGLQSSKLDKSGGTMTGDLNINNGFNSAVIVGGEEYGSDGSTVLRVGGITDYSHGGENVIDLPDGSGTIALTSDIPPEVEVIDPASATTTGKAADALKVKEALDGKLDVHGPTVEDGMTVNGTVYSRGYVARLDDTGNETQYNYGYIANGQDVLILPNASGTLALTSDIPAPYTPPSYLRVYDEVRQCWWLGRMVNGVINWEVE